MHVILNGFCQRLNAVHLVKSVDLLDNDHGTAYTVDQYFTTFFKSVDPKLTIEALECVKYVQY